MKKRILSSALTLALLMGGLMGCAEEKKPIDQDAALKVSQSEPVASGPSASTEPTEKVSEKPKPSVGTSKPSESSSKPEATASEPSEPTAQQPKPSEEAGTPGKPANGDGTSGNQGETTKPSNQGGTTKPSGGNETTTKPTASNPEPTEPKPTAHTHSYSATTVAPTCTAEGYTKHVCSCGESYNDSQTAALGHSYGEWVIIKEPTTEAEGEATRTCTRCGASQTWPVEKLPEPVKPVVTEADLPMLEEYARSYAESVGFIIDTSMNLSNSAYYPAIYMSNASIEEAKENIRGGIESTKDNLIGSDGNDEGFTSDARYRYNCVIGIDGYGDYEVYDLYG